MADPEIVEESIIHQGWLRIVKRELRHPNGGYQSYEIVNPGSHSVSVVALDTDDNVILVELYRFGQQMRLLELPAGAVDAGESYADAIARELLEETGYSGEFTEIGSHFIAAEHGVTRHVFAARNCTRTADPTPEQSEIDEGVRVVTVDLAKFRNIVRSGRLTETGAAYMVLDRLNLLNSQGLTP